MESAGRGAETAAIASACGVIGEIVGHFAALFIPDVYVSDPVLGHSIAALAGASATLWDIWRRRRPLGALKASLQEADKLFLTGEIDTEEHATVRRRSIEKHT